MDNLCTRAKPLAPGAGSRPNVHTHAWNPSRLPGVWQVNDRDV